MSSNIDKMHTTLTITCSTMETGKLLFLVVVFALIHPSEQQDICDVESWPAAAPPVPFPIGLSNSQPTAVTHFTIVNNVSTPELLRTFSGNQGDSLHDIFEERILNIEETSEYLAYDINHACVITTTAATCLTLATHDLPTAFLGVFSIFEETEDSIEGRPAMTEVEVHAATSGSTCRYGRIVILKEDDLTPVHVFCQWDSEAIHLDANSRYHVTYRADGDLRNPERHAVLFSIPFSASTAVTVKCGEEISAPGFDRVPDRPTSTIHTTVATSFVPPVTPQGQKDKSAEDNEFSPEMIALIAVICAVFIAVVAVVIFFIRWRRSKTVEKGPHSELTQNGRDPYEQVDITLARQNTYQEDPPKNVYERIISVEEGSGYAEIPADSQDNQDNNGQSQYTGNNQSQYATLSTDQSESTASPSDVPSHYMAISEAPTATTASERSVNIDSNADNNNVLPNRKATSTPENIEGLYAKPNKIPKRDELVNNSIYQSASRNPSTQNKVNDNEVAMDGSIDHSYIEIQGASGQIEGHPELEPKDSVVKMVNNEAYTGD